MSDQSNTSIPQTFVGSPSATSSSVSADGLSLCATTPDGLTTGQSGLEAAHASPSATPENSSDSQTLVTCGRVSKTSSLSVALQRCLENRLRRRLGEDRQISHGSILWRLTWVRSATSLGVRYSRLHRWEHPTSERDCTLWPTPMASSIHRIGLRETAWLITSGQTTNGSSAETEKGALLNPAFALSLMGFPDKWLSCGVRAMRSFLSKRPSSYSPSSKRGAK
jgi:hypothetical protein